MCGISILLILKGIMRFQSVHAFCWTKKWTLIKMKRNRKQKIPHTILERRPLYFSSYKNRKLKVKLWLVWDCERKKRAFFVLFIFSEGNFFNICFISIHSVLNTLSEYTFFYISKNPTSYTLCLFLKWSKDFSISLSKDQIGSNLIELLFYLEICESIEI